MIREWTLDAMLSVPTPEEEMNMKRMKEATEEYERKMKRMKEAIEKLKEATEKKVDMKYNFEKSRYECNCSDGFWVSYDGENWNRDVPLPPDTGSHVKKSSHEVTYEQIDPRKFKVTESGQVVKEDIIGHPNHYCEGRKYEPKDVIRDWNLNFNLGNTVKYISRNGRKDGNSVLQDLKKARQYLDFEIDFLEGEENAH